MVCGRNYSSQKQEKPASDTKMELEEITGPCELCNKSHKLRIIAEKDSKNWYVVKCDIKGESFELNIEKTNY